MSRRRALFCSSTCWYFDGFVDGFRRDECARCRAFGCREFDRGSLGPATKTPTVDNVKVRVPSIGDCHNEGQKGSHWAKPQSHERQINVQGRLSSPRSERSCKSASSARFNALKPQKMSTNGLKMPFHLQLRLISRGTKQ